MRALLKYTYVDDFCRVERTIITHDRLSNTHLCGALQHSLRWTSPSSWSKWNGKDFLISIGLDVFSRVLSPEGRYLSFHLFVDVPSASVAICRPCALSTDLTLHTCYAAIFPRIVFMVSFFGFPRSNGSWPNNCVAEMKSYKVLGTTTTWSCSTMVLNEATGNVITVDHATWFKAELTRLWNKHDTESDWFMVCLTQSWCTNRLQSPLPRVFVKKKKTLLHIHTLRSVVVWHPLSYSPLPEYRHSHFICNWSILARDNWATRVQSNPVLTLKPSAVCSLLLSLFFKPFNRK